MRKPRNVGTKRNPKYAGAIRYKGQERWVGTFPTAGEWKEAALAKIAEMQADQPEDPLTVAAFVGTKHELGAWLAKNKKRRGATVERYMEGAKPFVEEFGDLRFDQLPSTFKLRGWAEDQRVHVLKAIRIMWNDAIKRSVTTRPNPFSDMGMEEPKGRKNITVLTAEDVDLLAQCAYETRPGPFGDMLRALIYWQAYTAVRPGEGAAQRRDQVNLDEGTAEVTHQVGKDGKLVPTKTVTGEREIAVPRKAAEAVRIMPVLHPDHLFVAVRGGLIYGASGWHYYWNPIRTAFMAALPKDHQLHLRIAKAIAEGKDPTKCGEGEGHFQLYELRHFGLTRMLELGRWNNVIDVCVQAGHRSPDLLYSTYGHPDKKKAISRLLLLDDLEQGLTPEDERRLTAG